MSRQRLVWLLCVPFTALAGAATHLAVQRVPVPHHDHGAHPVGGHLDVGHLPLCLSVCVGVAAAAYVLAVARGWTARPPLWLFAAVPPVGFVAQEQIVSFTEHGAPSLGAALVLGLVLQIPFAFAAYATARAVLEAAATVARLLRSRPPQLLRGPTFLLEPVAVSWPRRPALALGHGQRAPPAGC